MTTTNTCAHEETEEESACCAASPYYGFCGACHDHASWNRVCMECGETLAENVDVEEQRP
ncbi:hypothetical protein CMI37_21780 [Candidatus Pacearchaeota archaeon]|nr:hypothetical protein [Candidatus Pacearchaeota archaeon]